MSVAAALVIPGAARASGDGDQMLTGQVVSAQSRWVRGGTAIVTDSVMRLDDGRQVTVRQLGGSVDGIGMVAIPSPAVLAAGDRVTAEVAIARDLSGRESRVVQRLWMASAPEPGTSGVSGGTLMPFVRTVASRTRAPLAWEANCATISFHSAGTTHVDGDGEFAEMEAVIAHWNDVIRDCSYLDLEVDGHKDGEVGLDGTNLVIYREDRWCRPASGDDAEECYDPSAAGLTTLFFIDDNDSDRNGAILDADIELNAVDFAIARDGQTNRPGRCISEISNTFTHEVGHLMGLDHTCWAGGDRLEDDQGNPQMNCDPVDALPSSVTEATMYNFQDCGETKKETLEPDDVNAVCTIYPAGADPGTCDRVGTTPGCCSTAGETGVPLGPVLGALGFGVLLLRRRRSPPVN